MMSNFKKLRKHKKCNSRYNYYIQQNITYKDENNHEQTKKNKVYLIDVLNEKYADDKIISYNSKLYYYCIAPKNRRFKNVLGSKKQYEDAMDYLEKNILRIDKLTDKEYQELCTNTKKYVLFIKEEVSASIIRKIYDRVIDTDNLIKMSPFLAYQIGRNVNKSFYVDFIELIEKLIKKTVDTHNNQLDNNIEEFLEMLIAYYKYYVPNDN